MTFDFDTVVDRRRKDAYKWNVSENELPMWVADMDFKTAPAIIKSLQDRVNHGIFGYSEVPAEWADAYISWWKNRHEFAIEKESLIFCTGVVPAISSVVRRITQPAENVVIQTPVYNIFYNSILNNGRNVLENPLKYDGYRYEMDFEDLERKLSNPQTSMLLLCNPANPAGVIWNVETLAKVGELCKQYGVTVVSDEIHCDITDPDKSYTPFASVSETCKNISISLLAPTKCFNLAGIQTSAVMISDKVLRHKIWRGLNNDEVAEPNAFAIDAAIAAFNEGGEWLDALREYIFENKQIVKNYIKDNIPEISLVESEATYLLWLDCSRITDDSAELAINIRKRTGLFLAEGSQYGGNGRFFLRMNIACPRILLMDGLNRLKGGLT